MDIDGSLLALSLDDSFKNVIQRRSISNQWSDGSDMEEEIQQSVSDIEMSEESVETIKQFSTPKKQTEPEQDSSFASALSTILLPTNFGAKFALERNLSLIKRPFPHTPVRHIDSFLSSDISVTTNATGFKEATPKEFPDEATEVVYNPITRNYDEDVTGVIHKRIDTSTPTPTPTSVQVHHHHYYYSPTPSNIPNLSHELSQNSYQYSPYASNNSLSEYRTADISLPQPWQKESAPKEKHAYVISTYLQLIINFSLSVYGIYLIYNIISTIRKDIDSKLQGQIINLKIEIDNCRRNYHENNCVPDLIVPAMERPCEYWLKCMNQNLDIGNKSSISAETLGVIINSLIEPLGFKFFTVFIGFIILVFGMNFGFGFIRAKSYYGT